MELDRLVKVLNIVLLVAMMLAIGLRVELSQVLATIRHKSLVVRSLAANFVLVPLLTLLLLLSFHAQPMPAAGFLICLLLWLNLSRPAKIAGAVWMIAGIGFGAWKTRVGRLNGPPPRLIVASDAG